MEMHLDRMLSDITLSSEHLDGTEGTSEFAVGKQMEAAEMNKRQEMKKREVAKKSEAVESAAATKKREEQRKKLEVTRKRCSKAVYMTQAEKSKIALDNYRESSRKKDEENPYLNERIKDPYGYQARMFHMRWDEIYGAQGQGYGNIDDTTGRFILESESDATSYSSLQIISVKVSELTGQWPLDVYGLIAVRDSHDHRRNIIFERSRENYQTLTVEDPCLVLTGPMRAVMVFDPVLFEVSLYVRGTGNSEDRELSFLAARCLIQDSWDSKLIQRSYSSRLSTLDFTLAYIDSSVEATISLKVISGLPNGVFGEFAAFSTDIKDKVVLHKSGAKEFYLAGDEIHLSRSVVSIGMAAKLRVSITFTDGIVKASGSVDLDPLKKGTSYEDIFVGDVCQFEVSVVWSLFPSLA